MNLNLTIANLAADIARRVPDMAKDSAVNNEALIARLLADEFCKADALVMTPEQHNAFPKLKGGL